MTLTQLITFVNAKLAGEILTYDQLKVHLDAVIDDINSKLNSTFPSFSEFNSTDYSAYPNYNLFPDKYIRSVVTTGAAFYFYITDEEGALSAIEYGKEYQTKLFEMQRDYSNSIPSEYQATAQGYVLGDVCSVCGCGASSCCCSDDESTYFPNIRYVENTSTLSAWNGRHLTMGNYHIWIDSSKRLRIKDGQPTSETDGTLIVTVA